MKRIAHEFTQKNLAPPSTVFPLLCPVREAEWVPGWKYRLVYSKSGFAEKGCVFATPAEDGSQITWTVTRFEPATHKIEFCWVWPEMISTLVEISLIEAVDRNTSATIRYTYTALSAAGEGELDRYDQEWFENKMKMWETAINHFLETGHAIGDPHLASR